MSLPVHAAEIRGLGSAEEILRRLITNARDTSKRLGEQGRDRSALAQYAGRVNAYEASEAGNMITDAATLTQWADAVEAVLAVPPARSIAVDLGGLQVLDAAEARAASRTARAAGAQTAKLTIAGIVVLVIAQPFPATPLRVIRRDELANLLP